MGISSRAGTQILEVGLRTKREQQTAAQKMTPMINIAN